MIVIDTSVIYALLDRNDQRHIEAFEWYERVRGEELATTPLVLAEVDHLAEARIGAPARQAFRRDVRSGAYSVEWWARAVRETVSVADRYDDLGISLTDASLVALASHLRTNRIATFDERHFHAVEPLDGAGSFSLLPRDEHTP